MLKQEQCLPRVESNGRPPAHAGEQRRSLSLELLDRGDGPRAVDGRRASAGVLAGCGRQRAHDRLVVAHVVAVVLWPERVFFFDRELTTQQHLDRKRVEGDVGRL